MFDMINVPGELLLTELVIGRWRLDINLEIDSMQRRIQRLRGRGAIGPTLTVIKRPKF